jgi:hypothetical protein
MALMDKPENDPEVATETDSVIRLEEDGDVQQENLEYQNLAAYVQSQFTRAKTSRQSDEDRWLTSYRDYRGLYDDTVQFTSTEKSRAFIKIAKTKCLAAYSMVTDVLFAGSKFPIGIESQQYPEGVENTVNYDPNAITTEKVKEKAKVDFEVPRTVLRPEIERELGILKSKTQPIHEELESGASAGPTAVNFEPAKKAALKMERKMHDQLEESEASKHLRSMVFEMSLFGSGIMKGPFAEEKEYAGWSEDGEYSPTFQTIPKIEYVSVWDFYPDPDARNMSEAEYTIQRHRMSKSQLRQLKKRPHFRDESIELAIELGPSYVKENWEDTLEESHLSEIHRFEVLEYWGIVDKEVAEEAELEIPEELEDKDQFQVNVWICNDQILRLVMNPFTPVRIPYHCVPFELNPYSMFGIGVVENMSDTTILMNGFMRMAVDNSALSGNLMVEIDETHLTPGQDLEIYPGKVFRRSSGQVGAAIHGTKFPNISNELFMMFDKSRQLADEATGIPSYAHGMSGVMSTGRTAAGMSMLMGAAAQMIKSVVRNIDDYLLSPMGKSMFAFNMQFLFEEEFTKGDLSVTARGTESLMRNEVRSQRLLQFMQMSAGNQMLMPMVKYDYILRELAASMDLDEDKILNDPREALIQAKMMAEIQSKMPQPEGQPPQEGGPPNPQDPTGTGGGNINAGEIRQPNEAGFTGGGGGNNGGQPAPQAPQGPVQ